MDFALINWPAVGAGTIAAFVLGWLIYAPFALGKGWAASTGIEMPGPGTKPPMFAMLAQLLALFLLALIIGLTETAQALDAAILAILSAAALVVANGAFSGKNRFAMSVDGLGIVGYGVVMIAAQGIL